MKNRISDSTEFESAIYKGRIRHRRFMPNTHEFEYPIFMFLLKANEIPKVIQKFWQFGSSALCWVRFRRKDYVGGSKGDLDQAVRTKIAEKLGKQSAEIEGEVYLLGHLRYFGFYFSPLNLYYLKQEGKFRYMLAEVSNTPWNEKHYYLVDLHEPQRHSKEFHVSPFNPMEQDYQWRVTPPASDSKHCLVHIDIFGNGENQKKVFDATLILNRVALNQKQLWRVLLTTPIQTFSMAVGIYWQALKLMIKRTPYHPHPTKSSAKAKEGMI